MSESKRKTSTSLTTSPMDLTSDALGEGACRLRGTIPKTVFADDRRFLEVARSTRVGHSCHHRADHKYDETDLQLSRLTPEVGDG